VPDESLGNTARRARRRLRLGAADHCACGEDDPVVLRRTQNGTECAECQALRRTGHARELHHPAGHANSGVVVPLGANTHARLTDAQHDWPPDTLRNPRQHPARRLAAILRAAIDTLQVIGDPLTAELEELGTWLESLDGDPPRPP
jgi:hypothetical protein